MPTITQFAVNMSWIYFKITEIIDERDHEPTSKSKDFSSSRLLLTSASFIWSREKPSSLKFFASFKNTSAYKNMTLGS